MAGWRPPRTVHPGGRVPLCADLHAVLAQLAAFGPRRIVPRGLRSGLAVLARALAALVEQGDRLARVQPPDRFPGTPPTECVATRGRQLHARRGESTAVQSKIEPLSSIEQEFEQLRRVTYWNHIFRPAAQNMLIDSAWSVFLSEFCNHFLGGQENE